MAASVRNTEPIAIRLGQAIMRYIGLDIEPPPVTSHNNDRHIPGPHILQAVPTPQQPEPQHKWQRHPLLRNQEQLLSDDEREARHAAIRGLFALRASAMDLAQAHFVSAARCPDVDLTAIPGFWELTRGQMLVAVHAYEDVQRYREAAALDALIRNLFKPKLVHAAPVAYLHEDLGRDAASS